MKIKIDKIFPFLIYSTLLLMLSLTSCKPQKKGQSTASCASGEKFNSRTQKCEGFLQAPGATLTVVEMNEDGPDKTIVLEYQDVNQEKAKACRVVENEQEIELTSPQAKYGVPSAKAGIALGIIARDAIDSAAFPTHFTNASLSLISAESALTAAESATDNDQFKNALNTAATKLAEVGTFARNAGVNTGGQNVIDEATKLATIVDWITRRCYCTGGSCSTILSSEPDKFGVFGFKYNVEDESTGESAYQNVTVDVLSVNDLPIPYDQDIPAVNESLTSTPLPFTVTMPSGNDIDSLFLTYSLDYTSLPTKGTLSGCLTIAGQFTCTYTPSSGDSGVALADIGIKSSREIDGITYTAKFKGFAGDSISVEYLESSIKNVGTKVEVQVEDRKILVFIDPTQALSIHNHIKTAIENHPVAAAFVDVAVTTPGTLVVLDTPRSLQNGKDSFDQFQYIVNDGISNSTYKGRVSVEVLSQNDAPVNSNTGSGPFVITEDTASTQLTLGYSDVESETALSCFVNPADAINLIFTSNCTCLAGVCSIWVRPKQNYNGSASFKYQVTTNTNSSYEYYGGSSSSISIIGVNDAPMPSHGSLTVNESDTSSPLTYAVAIPVPSDVDSSSFTYGYVGVTGGTVSNCLGLNGTANNDLVCAFTPTDGNVFGTGGIASALIGTSNLITVQSKYTGISGNNISVQIVDHFGVIPGSEFVEVAYSAGEKVNFIVHIDSGNSNLGNVVTALNSDASSSQLITASTASSATVAGAFAQTYLVGGSDGAGKFTYSVSDGSTGSSYNGAINIDITEKNDPPVLCAFDSFKTAPECGLNGCYGENSPIGSITPRSVGVIYYHKKSAICYKSTGTSSNNDWSIIEVGGATAITGLIKDQNTNQTGKVLITNIRLDEGGGEHATASEDAQQILIEKVVVSDTTLIPLNDNNIRFYFGGSKITIANFAATPLATVGDANSEDEKEFRIEIIPQNTLVGTANIEIHLKDTDPASATTIVSFNVTVGDASANHQGWVNLTAFGPSVNKFDISNDAKKVCNYSETKCNGGFECTGSVDPTVSLTITPAQKNAVFYNSASDKCYYSTGTTTSSWVEFQSYCGITPAEYETGCDSTTNASCIGDNNPTTLAIVPTKLNSMFYDKTNNKCYRSIGYTTNDWEEYKATAEVKLQWNAFSVSPSLTSSISGYNVYRRLSGESFNYEVPVNKTLITNNVSGTYTFTDNAANSRFAPLSRTVYFYEIRPVVSSGSPAVLVETGTSETYSVIRVTVPDDNKTFVHRWIVNQTICRKMHASEIDIDDTNNYRCPYAGPGDSLIGGTSYYDFGRDLIVDRFEAGCPYTLASDVKNCGADTSDGSCLGIGNPNTDGVTAGDGAIYYSRGTGQCFKYDLGGTTWSEVNALAGGQVAASELATRYSLAEIPPLVNITQEKARDFCKEAISKPILGLCEFSQTGCGGGGVSACTGAGDPNGVMNTIGSGYVYLDSTNNKCYQSSAAGTGSWSEVYAGGEIAVELPTRKDQMAYSEWDFDDSSINDSVVLNYEVGLSLNVDSKCNSTSASGLTGYFSDSESPDINSLFTIPGTNSSGIRTLINGSDKTKSCQSKYGVQDAIGNVSEWTVERMVCADANNCNALVSTDPLALTLDNDMAPSVASAYDVWRIGFNGANLLGPCGDSNSPCATPLTDWTIDTLSFKGSRIAIPMGLLVASSFQPGTSGLENDPVAPYMKMLNNSSGLTSSQTHKDTVVYNTTTINADANNCGGMVTGGSYLTGTGAGVYHHEFIPCTTASANKRVDVGFRCVAPVTNYLE